MVLCFAYGSNMCRGWLHRRVPSARFIQAARLHGHVLRFHKKSSDGSGKGDAFRTGLDNDIIWGALIEVPGDEKPKLDAAEGLGKGYADKCVSVVGQDGNLYQAMMYQAQPSHLDPELKPYSWYKDLVLSGARSNNLPSAYIEALEAVEAIEDIDEPRARKAIEALSGP
jgi:hypothetical protein